MDRQAHRKHVRREREDEKSTQLIDGRFRSDADSDVLADYVIALLKHDGDKASVRKLCEEEIPDFLTEGW